LFKQSLFRSVISLGISSIIGLSVLGFGHASASSSSLVIGTATYMESAVKVAAATAPAAPAKPAAAPAPSKVDTLISIGKQYLGVKYQFGAKAGSTIAFDCSSYTQYIFKKIGISLPRTSSSQATVGTKVAKASLKAGDLVFFSRPGVSGIGHVAVYIGNNKMLGASGDKVQVSSLNTSYWTKNYVTARRVL